MTIGYDAKRLFHNSSGLGNYARALVDNLQTYHPDITSILYTPSTPKDYQNLHWSNRIAVPELSPGPLWRSYVVTHQLKTDNVDLYHGLSNELPFNIRRGKVKSIVTVHDLIFKAFPETYPLLDRTIYDYKTKTACRNADHIVAVSEHTKADIIRHYGTSPEKITVISPIISPLISFEKRLEEYNRVDYREDNWHLRFPSPFLLALGTVEARKNFDQVVAALAQLPKEQRPMLVLAGKLSTGLEQLRKGAAELGMSDYIKPLGFVESDDLNHLLCRAEALVYPSRYEGFGMPVAEALLAGLPVITSTTSSLPEASGGHALHVDPDDINGMAAAIQDILTDPEATKARVNAGRAYAERAYSPRRLTNQLVELYARVLGH